MIEDAMDFEDDEDSLAIVPRGTTWYGPRLALYMNMRRIPEPSPFE